MPVEFLNLYVKIDLESRELVETPRIFRRMYCPSAWLELKFLENNKISCILLPQLHKISLILQLVELHAAVQPAWFHWIELLVQYYGFLLKFRFTVALWSEARLVYQKDQLRVSDVSELLLQATLTIFIARLW